MFSSRNHNQYMYKHKPTKYVMNAKLHNQFTYNKNPNHKLFTFNRGLSHKRFTFNRGLSHKRFTYKHRLLKHAMDVKQVHIISFLIPNEGRLVVVGTCRFVCLDDLTWHVGWNFYVDVPVRAFYSQTGCKLETKQRYISTF